MAIESTVCDPTEIATGQGPLLSCCLALNLRVYDGQQISAELVLIFNTLFYPNLALIDLY